MAAESYLPEFVREVMERQNLSTYDVARRSQNKIAAATVLKIKNGDIRSSSVDTLDALADGLGVSQHAVYNAARGIDNDMPERYQTYAERFDAADVTEAEWQFLETIFNDNVRAFKETKRRMEAGDFTGSANQEMALQPVDEPKIAAKIESERATARNEISDSLKKAGEAVKKRRAR